MMTCRPGRVDGDAGGGGHVNAGVAVWHVIHRVHPVAEAEVSFK
ncbi:MAG: hypothetical protein ACLRIS_19550 [Flavonifractor plautii]